jgi:hypothetical protein
MPDAVPADVALLEFDHANLITGDDADIRNGLSAVVVDGDALWLACDEGCRLERLSRADASGLRFASHAVFPLSDFLALPAAVKEEADIEGLDIDDEWLWMIGSHSLKRKRPKKETDAVDVAAKLAERKRDGNRHLLARVPLEGSVPRTQTAAGHAGSIGTSSKSSVLLDAIVHQKDEHLAPFIEIPGKDNGLDIEGLAVREKRAFVGLRGPVLREWCCILELALEADADGTLRLMPVDGAVPYRKHFLKLSGLGVRDIIWVEDDLIILAGPTMAHDGPIEIWLWKNAAKTPSVSIDTRRLLSLPFGPGGDRAEGLTVFDSSGSTSVLVVFDSPSKDRLVGPSSVRADIFRLP